MVEVIINTCFGGFGLSSLAYERYAELKGLGKIYWYESDYSEGYGKSLLRRSENPNKASIPYAYLKDMGDKFSYRNEESNYFLYLDGSRDIRTDPILVQVVKELGEKANGPHADLKIVEVPDDVKWEIDEYDGAESIEEVHRSWS